MAKLVDIQGRFPCEPDNKKPTLIKKWEYSTALYPPNNAFTSDNTFTLVTTDTFMLGIYELGPGGVFAPLDIHPGDESYYILNGPVVQRSGNGQFAYLETGEGLFMPEGAWHCCHNFSDQKTRILYFITPKAWDEHIPPAVIPTEEETKFYKGPNNDNLPDMRGAIKDISRQGCTDDIGCWPVDPAEARKTGAVYAVRDFEIMFMEQLIQCYFVSLQVMITDTLEKWYFQQEDTDQDVQIQMFTKVTEHYIA